ncbi:hypothetical protein LR48_Vigan11g127100 [Vigna angularis]|uniref:Uncharacterized protein n=1 Tax=Phaseolus angularis TaxID=3914 RepID=A0A0L9VTP7_PHAAN|nr:hypothetical protein LR48_Vigan11g127100 [Vigna angularis]
MREDRDWEVNKLFGKVKNAFGSYCGKTMELVLSGDAPCRRATWPPGGLIRRPLWRARRWFPSAFDFDGSGINGRHGCVRLKMEVEFPYYTCNALEEILHGRVIIKLGSMAGSPNGLDDQPQGANFS